MKKRKKKNGGRDIEKERKRAWKIHNEVNMMMAEMAIEQSKKEENQQ